MVSYPADRPAAQARVNRKDSDSYALLAVTSLMLGILVAVLGLFSLFMWIDAHNAKDAAQRAAAKIDHPSGSMAGMDLNNPLQSYAGASPANGADLAAAHKPFPATLPPVTAGPVAHVRLVLTDKIVQIAPGVKYSTWAWGGGSPGPIIHVRQGQWVDVTLTNRGDMAHSVDFHAARVAPDKDFVDVLPGKSFHFRFQANDPGIFMYHCGTKPVLMHIANGMYGAIVVEPKAGVLPHADRNYVLVASEWYLDSDGLTKPAQFSMDKAHARLPDWMTFNGYANQYVTHPLTAKVGQTVRFWVLDAGPSLDTDFHVVGTIFVRAYPFSDLTDPNQALHNIQTMTVPSGGAAVFDVKIDQPGTYPFVSHSFSAVDEGQVGLLKVG